MPEPVEAEEAQRAQAVVIGGSGVLGSAIARRLASEHRVLATYFSGREEARRLLESGCLIERLDVRDESAIEALLRRTRPRALVLCAGAGGDGLVARLSVSSWHEALAVHLDGLFWALRAALKYLPDEARVVWLGSRVGQSGGVGQGAYAACKAGGQALLKVAACEGGARRIAFNTVCPGFALSPLTQGLGSARLLHERERDAWGELGRPELCANLVAWLLSPAARGLSGQVLHADARLE